MNETGLTLLDKEKKTIDQLVLVNMPSGSTLEDAQLIALKEISNCQMLASQRPDLLKCTPQSFLLAVKQCICDGLTLAPSAGLVYLVPSLVKVGQNGSQDIKEWVVSYDPTANGRLSMAFQSGSILDVKRPTFTFDSEGKLDTVSVEFLVPSFPEPRWEVIVFGKVHFKKWMDASAKKNKGAANANYTSWNGGIDPEFASTKAIRHGLSKRGTNLNNKRSQVSNFKPVISQEAIAKEEIEIAEIITGELPI